MKPLFLLTASALALTAVACAPKAPVARAALECPARQGELTRTGAAADGKSCTYVSESGADVTLQLVSAPRGADQALTDIETHLLGERRAQAADKTGEDSKDKAAVAVATSESKTQAEKAIAEANADAEGSDVKVAVSKDGKATVVEGHDGVTQVNLPGIHITANDENDSANVQVGPLHVNANGNSDDFTMRFGPRDVRMRGEALSPQKRGMRATFLYTGKDLPEGYRYVGYEAAGPKVGPITVAIVKGKSKGESHDKVSNDVTRLVRLNGGV